MPFSDPILSVSGLSVSFSGLQALHAVRQLSFSLLKGETLAIVGESGSGKSMTALCLAGLQPKTAAVTGEISLLDTAGKQHSLLRITEKEWQQLRGTSIGMIFQEPMSALNPIMSAGKQLTESIRSHNRISAREARQLALSWLAKVKLPEPEKLYHRYPHQLSGGQKQRVMIAMAMCRGPQLLLADEPTTALDATVQREIILLMNELQRESGASMVFITHDLALAAELANKVLVMYQGDAVEYGSVAEVLTQPQHAYTRALLACRPDMGNKGKKLPVVSDFLVGGAVVTELLPEMLQDKDTNILEVRDLKVWFPEGKNLLGRTKSYFKAVDGVSFDIKKGTTMGLVGESGCGKSTLSRSLMGLLPVHSGHIYFGGADLALLKGRQWQPFRRQLQMIFQDPFASLNPRMRVADIIAEPLLLHRITNSAGLSKETARLLDLVQLPAGSGSKYPHQFSGGQRQRIGIARALALQPQLLICDESVSALDVSVQAQILNLLKELQYEFQLSYLFISHDLAVVHYISDSILVMQRGHIVESGEADSLLRQPQQEYTRQLIAAMPGSKFNPEDR